MAKPRKIPAFVRELAAEARRQGMTAYALQKESGVPIATAHRLMAGDLNPTASTIAAVATALGLTITFQRR
jgi:DNA-binding phage protein